MSESFRVDAPACLRADFAPQLAAAEWAADRVIETITQTDFSTLEARSPGLKGLNWPRYIRSSLVRMVRTLFALERSGLDRGRVLDYGSYFGNFSMMLARSGFTVTAVDAYGDYGPALLPQVELMGRHGIDVRDSAVVGRLLEGLPDGCADAVICLGVIEHVPHTPRFLLAALDRVLAPGGVLVLDTPNLAYIYKRQTLARGDSVMPDIAVQYPATVPFEGHHREYTPYEVAWMLAQLGHVDLHVQTYIFSLYELGLIQGRDLDNLRAMIADPSMRELILTASRKGPGPSGVPSPVADWRACLVEPEQWWYRQPGLAATAVPVDVGAETLAARLQQEVNRRDEMLARLHADMQREVGLRDQMLQTLQDQVNRMSRSK